MNRRQFIAYSAASSGTLSLTGLPGSLQAQPSKAAGNARLKMLIPANAGGGWDATGRALGAALVEARAYAEVDYENKGGKGGVLGLQHFVERYDSDTNALLVGGMVMVGSIALLRPAIDLSRVVPLVRLTGDYLVLVVAQGSPLKDAREFVAALKRDAKSLTISGGSAGGIDHMMVGMMARELSLKPTDMSYLATTSGADSLKALQDGRAQVAVAGYSEFKDAIASGQVRALGISAGRSTYGVASLIQAGLRVELSNWRGVFAPRAISAEQQAALRQAVVSATATDSWRSALRKNSWEPKVLLGADLAQFVEREQSTARVMIHLLGIKA